MVIKRKKKIIAINIETGEQRIFNGICEAQRCLETKHISAVLSGKRNKAKGYTFKYYEGGDDSTYGHINNN